MWARVAAFEGTDVGRARSEAGKETARRADPRWPERCALAHGCGGQPPAVITLFDSREQIEAAEQLFERMGDQIDEDLRGRRVSRDYYEVAASVVALVGDMK